MGIQKLVSLFIFIYTLISQIDCKILEGKAQLPPLLRVHYNFFFFALDNFYEAIKAFGTKRVKFIYTVMYLLPSQ